MTDHTTEAERLTYKGFARRVEAELDALNYPESHALRRAAIEFINGPDQAAQIATLKAELAAARDAAVQVKPLEWEESEGNFPGQRIWCYDDAQTMWIVKNPDDPDFVWCETISIDFAPVSPVKGVFTTLEAAKAAAQTDYENRIRSALAPHRTVAEVRDDALWKAGMAVHNHLAPAPIRDGNWKEYADAMQVAIDCRETVFALRTSPDTPSNVRKTHSAAEPARDFLASFTEADLEEATPEQMRNAFRLARKMGDAPDPHYDDLAVDRFAAAMKAKLAKKRQDGRGGWSDPEQCSQQFLSDLLRSHIEKGDPVDVGNFAMMLHQRGETVAPAPDPVGEAARVLLAAMTERPQKIDPFDACVPGIEALAIKHAGNLMDPVGQLEIAEEFFVAALRALAGEGE